MSGTAAPASIMDSLPDNVVGMVKTGAEALTLGFAMWWMNNKNKQLSENITAIKTEHDTEIAAMKKQLANHTEMIYALKNIIDSLVPRSGRGPPPRGQPLEYDEDQYETYPTTSRTERGDIENPPVERERYSQAPQAEVWRDRRSEIESTHRRVERTPSETSLPLQGARSTGRMVPAHQSEFRSPSDQGTNGSNHSQIIDSDTIQYSKRAEVVSGPGAKAQSRPLDPRSGILDSQRPPPLGNGRPQSTHDRGSQVAPRQNQSPPPQEETGGDIEIDESALDDLLKEEINELNSTRKPGSSPRGEGGQKPAARRMTRDEQIAFKASFSESNDSESDSIGSAPFGRSEVRPQGKGVVNRLKKIPQHQNY